MSFSLERTLSKLGYCSRTEAAKLISEGKVSVDGKTVTSKKRRVLLESKIVIQGKETIKKVIWILLNKPINVITSNKDPEGRKTVYDIVKVETYVFPVGRLDYDTSGLLLMTNDNKLADYISSPESHIDKIYHAKIKGNIDIKLLENGTVLEGELVKPKEVKIITNNPNSTIIEITLTEGKNRQIKRMLQALNIKLISLKRIAIGELRLDNLKPGEYRLLKEEEIQKLKPK